MGVFLHPDRYYKINLLQRSLLVHLLECAVQKYNFTKTSGLFLLVRSDIVVFFPLCCMAIYTLTFCSQGALANYLFFESPISTVKSPVSDLHPADTPSYYMFNPSHASETSCQNWPTGIVSTLHFFFFFFCGIVKRDSRKCVERGLVTATVRWGEERVFIFGERGE